jgi:hypothetical protein
MPCLLQKQLVCSSQAGLLHVARTTHYNPHRCVHGRPTVRTNLPLTPCLLAACRWTMWSHGWREMPVAPLLPSACCTASLS